MCDHIRGLSTPANSILQTSVRLWNQRGLSISTWATNWEGDHETPVITIQPGTFSMAIWHSRTIFSAGLFDSEPNCPATALQSCAARRIRLTVTADCSLGVCWLTGAMRLATSAGTDDCKVSRSSLNRSADKVNQHS